MDDRSELATALRGGSEVVDDDDEDDNLAITHRKRSLEKEERRLRVLGYTIDMSVNLGNSSAAGPTGSLSFQTFTERIIWVGRAQSAASDCISPSAINALPSLRKGKPRKPPKRRKKRRKSQRKGQQEEVAGDAIATVVVPVDGGCDMVPKEPVHESSVVREERQQCDNRTSGADMRKEADDGNEQKQVTALNAKHSTSTVGAWRVEGRDLDVGGRYKIPKKRKWDMGSDIRSL